MWQPIENLELIEGQHYVIRVRNPLPAEVDFPRVGDDVHWIARVIDGQFWCYGHCIKPEHVECAFKIPPRRTAGDHHEGN